ncbi:RNase H family protein [Sulfurimonas sp.]|uniref:ribonuclease HI n=1 Tax=Sulfurimonas sp. TaxID=2022749 RepID=UPI0025ED3ABA|nr:RNase H family protein [Sulfurimonas sp.]
MTDKQTLYLFTDGSANPKTKIGFGAYLLLNEEELYSANLNKTNVTTKMFEQTSSSKLELQALLWALSTINIEDSNLVVYTDCQNTVGLKGRRERFEKNNYKSKKKDLIANHELYKEFYIITDDIECEFIKVKGHKKNEEKNSIDKIFTLVDIAARDALRESFL